jgi:hypothetical protein
LRLEEREINDSLVGDERKYSYTGGKLITFMALNISEFPVLQV